MIRAPQYGLGDKPAPAPVLRRRADQQPTTPDLSLWQRRAATRYAEDVEKAQRPTPGRVHAVDRLKGARAVLSQRQLIVVDYVCGKGLTLLQLAQRVPGGANLSDLAMLLGSALGRLAKHYQAADAADAADDRMLNNVEKATDR